MLPSLPPMATGPHPLPSLMHHDGLSGLLQWHCQRQWQGQGQWAWHSMWPPTPARDPLSLSVPVPLYVFLVRGLSHCRIGWGWGGGLTLRPEQG